MPHNDFLERRLIAVADRIVLAFTHLQAGVHPLGISGPVPEHETLAADVSSLRTLLCVYTYTAASTPIGSVKPAANQL